MDKFGDGSTHGGLCVPLYVYPGGGGLASWKKVVDTILENNLMQHSFVILNPDNGDFGLRPYQSISQGSPSMSNLDFLNARLMIKSSGAATLGYIHTNYGKRPAEIIRDRIKLYNQLYNTEGVLFDEMPHERGYEDYYSSLGSYAKDLGMRYTVGNPGTAVPESYINSLDTLIIYEDSGYPDLATITARTFDGAYPSQKFGIIAHGLRNYSTDWTKNALALVKYIYLTTNGPPDPYSSVSGLLESLARDIRASP